MGCASSSQTKETASHVSEKYVAPPQPAPESRVPKQEPVKEVKKETVKEAIPEAATPITVNVPVPKVEPAPHSPPSIIPPISTTPPAEALSPTNDTSNVEDTLFKISTLMQKFAEVRNERTTPVQVLRKVLDLVVADCHASFASVQTISEDLTAALMMAMIGAPENYLEQNRLQKLAGTGTGTAADVIVRTSSRYLIWRKDGAPAPLMPSDWKQLTETSATLSQISAVPITVADKIIGVLTIGVDAASMSQAKGIMWTSYMQLLSASMSGMIKDNSIPKYMPMVRDVHETAELDSLVHKLVGHFRVVLGHTNNTHVWYRLALTASSNQAATIFDDLTQVPAPSANRSMNSTAGLLLKDVQASGGIVRSVVNMKSTVMKISIHNRQQVMIPDVQKLINQSGNVSIDIFNTRLIKPPTSVLVFPLKVKQQIFGVVFCMSGVLSDFSDVSPRLRELCEVMSPHLLQALTTGGINMDYQLVQAAVPNADGSQSGSMSYNNQKSFSSANGGIDIGGSINSSAGSESYAMTHSRSSTGALVTGLTEKLNQKRIKSAMDFSNNQLSDIQITNLLGEGGFAKVFRGLWRGLTVGIKIVVDDGKNEKMVMKNAHEIAILSTLSHPHVTQAYLCLTDVLVEDISTQCMKHAHQSLLVSPPYKYLLSMVDKACHIEVIEYCDLGNLSTALKNQVFVSQAGEKVLQKLAEAAATGRSDVGVDEKVLKAGQPGVKINIRALLLTLIEIASAMGYLHSMGVVHCDMKPANVLLKSSNNDPRGFSVKVSDFGLSRVEDDDTSSSFPFNSCGTAAYVAPEALICNKKVNSSVDVYAFGILMWEMYTAQRPYGNMKQQQLVEEVVMRGLRPKFPAHAPTAYVQLAQACWSGSPQQRPTFEESLVMLNNMLMAMDDNEVASNASFDLASLGDPVEYMSSQNADGNNGKQNIGNGEGRDGASGNDYGRRSNGVDSPARATRPAGQASRMTQQTMKQ
ncbi:hypothetical protein CEUSTIGMA_g11385.t1 [Chlamydomonas eustigma]|uniref:Protein kinase domain-containing protein n=1 Tax=Chlamydomonas eustigma TaxID=1157962 RepID=A0A250XLI8_9CHLO|nr:hypothetical protein CEUSTIGMA_g11385.t1 [Chlamydomonas eustigma]|eukprot:GAX83961.1 hypothetical protein CEUSTIGMA_g11385.t1 [Chlamydomonas eustigma]